MGSHAEYVNMLPRGNEKPLRPSAAAGSRPCQVCDCPEFSFEHEKRNCIQVNFCTCGHLLIDHGSGLAQPVIAS